MNWLSRFGTKEVIFLTQSSISGGNTDGVPGELVVAVVDGTSLTRALLT